MLKHRIMSGVLIAGIIIILANYLPPAGAWVLLVLLSSIAQLEFYGLMDKAGVPVFRVYGTICGAAMISATFCTIGPDPEHMVVGYKWENMILLATLLVVFVRQFPQKHNDRPIPTIACTLLGIWYVPFLFNYFTRLAFGWSSAHMTFRVSDTGRMLIIYLGFVVKMADVGAFFVGRNFGRHKLLPRISPKKTWEGLIGGIAASIITSMVFYFVFDGKLGKVEMGWGDALLLGLLLSVVGVVGDLFESLMKRAAGTKDSGTLIPGMGGLLDVLDSLLFGAPVLYAYARLFLS